MNGLLMLESSTSDMVVLYSENWGGHGVLDPDITLEPLADLHTGLRQFHGSIISSLHDNGYL